MKLHSKGCYAKYQQNNDNAVEEEQHNVNLNWHSKYWKINHPSIILTTRELLDVLDQLEEEEIILRKCKCR